MIVYWSSTFTQCLTFSNLRPFVIELFFCWSYPIFCLIAATPVRTWERRRSRAVRPPKHDPTKPHCFLTQCPLNPEANCTNVSEETPYTWQPCQCASTWLATGVARAQWDKDILAGQTLPYTGRRWANGAPPHGSPGHGPLRHSTVTNRDL